MGEGVAVQPVPRRREAEAARHRVGSDRVRSDQIRSFQQCDRQREFLQQDEEEDEQKHELSGFVF